MHARKEGQQPIKQNSSETSEEMEGSINRMAREIYDFLEKKYTNKDVEIRDPRRALREVSDRLDLYELVQEITECGEILIHPFETGYKERIFGNRSDGVEKE